jgi:hypothetical protein
MAQQIVTTYTYSRKMNALENDIDRLALVTALATGDYRTAVQIKRRMAQGDVKPLTEADLPGVDVWTGPASAAA